MNLIHHRFSDSLLAILARDQERRKQFARLLTDRPTGIWITVRQKAAGADLKRDYASSIAKSFLITLLFLTVLFLLFPRFEPPVHLATTPVPLIQIQDIPETV